MRSLPGGEKGVEKSPEKGVEKADKVEKAEKGWHCDDLRGCYHGSKSFKQSMKPIIKHNLRSLSSFLITSFTSGHLSTAARRRWRGDWQAPAWDCGGPTGEVGGQGRVNVGYGRGGPNIQLLSSPFSMGKASCGGTSFLDNPRLVKK